MKINPHPTWKVIDSTKLQQYMDCPRQYFFKYILGWDSIEPSIHLEFGIAWHYAMEAILNGGYTEENVVLGYTNFLTHYRQFWSEIYDADNAPKSPQNVLRAMFQYIEEYPNDHEEFDILATEIAGVASLDNSKITGQPMELFFRMDTLMKGERGYAALEHKTAKNMSRVWLQDFMQSIQVGTYLHVLYSMYPAEEVDAVYINGFEPHNPPRTKQNGEPYANDTDNKFQRIPMRRSLSQMNDWFVTASSWMQDIERDTQMMVEEQDKLEEQTVMVPFRKNVRSCTKYFGCPFADLCRAWPNPMREPVHICQPGFTIRHWDPRPDDLGGEGYKAKKVVKI